jgi:hypothetical protein
MDANLSAARDPPRSQLTCVSNYRRTICGSILAKDYALRRINGIEEPIVKEPHAATAKLVPSSPTR